MKRLLPVAVLLAGALCACSVSEDAGDGVRSALLITLDTTRVQALGTYGGPAGVTPVLDALAAESLVYDAARTVAPLTLPAHASVMTGLYPPRHTVRDNSLQAVPASALTLAERAAEAGLQTAAFVAAAVLDPAFGLDQGFAVYDGPARGVGQRTSHYSERPAAEVVDAALAWIRGRDRSRGFFLWVHLFDPHAPYAPPPRFLRQAGGKPYLGEVAAMDDAIGRVLEALRATDGWEDTLVVVVADHGEALGEHGERTHGPFVYDSTMRVPFLVRHPDGFRAGERSDEIVSLVDVHPTLAEGLGLAEVGELDGRSLARRAVPEERGVYFESYYGYVNYGWSPIAGWADARGKYVHSAAPQLFDPVADPGELNNLAAARAGELERYRRSLGASTARAPLAQDADAVDAALLVDLRALGYSGAPEPEAGFPHPLDDTGRPSPHDDGQGARLREELATLHEAQMLFEESRDLEGAIAQLKELVSRSPGNLRALSYLSTYLLYEERFAEAEPLLSSLVRQGFVRTSTLNNLGICLERLDQPERAWEHYLHAHQLDPTHLGALRNLVRLARLRGDAEGERGFRAKLEALGGREP